ncbi:MAG: TetR/AcrR family transcriptional regulator [Kofleriaceae bacterium]|jgi:AcrR family transcriptional regulator|nr:TetR/AcrR family transcriptional regulator [Kofleriaceae bacterium]MBP6839312.1 TetR/AcrR family transcriptional regulator [Kofleriaceae bacterium]MBP9205831.1 TetR/AcrR family transcriptional regulator [Kofleriaceae bacterium]
MTATQERKLQERQARRRRIQEAARQVFAERGYAGASIEHIARAAQLSVGAIYLYFRSKEDLYVSLLEDTLAYFDGEMSRLRSRSDVADRLPEMWALLTTWSDRDAEGPRIVRLLAQPGVKEQLSPEVSTAISAGLARVRDHLGACVADGIHAGIYRAVNAGEIADVAWALLLGTFAANETRTNLDATNPGPMATSAGSAFAVLGAALGAPARPVASA